MTRAALTLHLIAVVLTVGPVTVAASLFPATLRSGPRRAALVGAGASGGRDDVPVPVAVPGPVSALLHRTCRTYGVLGLAVPALGIVTAARLGVLTEGWVLTSTALTLTAGLLLALVVVPGQRQALAGTAGTPAGDAAASRLAGATGAFSLLWVAVLVLMVLRPGSTLGA